MSTRTARTGTTTSGTVTFTVLVLAFFTLAAGVWALVSPRSFADFVDFPNHEHFLHDIGAFQIGTGVGLLLALVWPDSLAVVLGGFFVANTIHAVNHALDLDLGGHDYDPWGIGLLSVLTLVALVIRRRQLSGFRGRM